MDNIEAPSAHNSNAKKPSPQSMSMDSSNAHIVRKPTEPCKHKYINVNEKESNHINHLLLHTALTQAPLETLFKVSSGVGLCNLSHVNIVHVITILMALKTSSDKQINICELG